MYNVSEKLAIIRLVEDSELSVRRTLAEISVSRSSFYRWYRSFERDGYEGLGNCSRASSQHWNKIPDSMLCSNIAYTSDQSVSDSIKPLAIASELKKLMLEGSSG